MSDYQFFWRCAHHPIAMKNFFEKRMTCELGCHKQKLQWHHSGEHPLPQSVRMPGNLTLA